MIFKISIRNKIILFTTISILISCSVSGIYFLYNFYVTRKTEAFERLNSDVEQVASTITDRLRFINNSSFTVLASDSIRNWNNRKLDFSVNNSSTYYNIDKLQSEILSNFMFNDSWISKYINCIYLFADDNDFLLVTRVPENLKKIKVQFRKVYNDTNNINDMGFYHIDSSTQHPSIYFLRRINDISMQKQLTFIFSIDHDAVANGLKMLGDNVTANIIYKDTIMFSSNKLLVGTSVNTADETYGNICDISKLFVVKKKLAQTPFSIYISVPQDDIMEPILNSMVHYIIVLLVLIIVLGFIATIATTAYTSFIKEIHSGINEVRKSNYNTFLPTYRDAELNEISLAFNQMTSEIKRLINTVYKSELLLKEADIRLLQSQINPHFFINTLTTIGTNALLNGDNQTYKMTSSLCNMIDSSMYNTKVHSPFITVAKELEYIRCYLYLQQIRFQDKLNYKIDITDDDLLKLYIPRLIIEPFVENSVIHGIEDNINQGNITITIRKEKSDLIAIITDNGKGFNVVSVMNMKSQSNGRGHHIGIANTCKRLQLLFGKPYGVSFESTPMVKTSVYIRLPVITNPESYIKWGDSSDKSAYC